MSDSVSDSQEQLSQPDLFQEDDRRETPMDFDDGGVPIYVTLLWVGFIVSYIVYMVLYALEDFQAWGRF